MKWTGGGVTSWFVTLAAVVALGVGGESLWERHGDFLGLLLIAIASWVLLFAFGATIFFGARERAVTPVQPNPPAPGSPAERGLVPGWYPRTTGGERWWDGQDWTEHTR